MCSNRSANRLRNRRHGKIPSGRLFQDTALPPLTPEQAARLSATFLRDTTETVRAAAASVPIAGYVAYAPAGTEEALMPYLAPGMPLILADGSVPTPVGVEGFGRCLLHAIQALFDRGHAAACALSADTPTLPAATLVTAAFCKPPLSFCRQAPPAGVRRAPLASTKRHHEV
jgi:hypothetical protein